MGTKKAGLLRTWIQKWIFGEFAVQCRVQSVESMWIWTNLIMPRELELPIYLLNYWGAAEASDELRDGPAGPHQELLGAGGSAQPRPCRARLPARGEDDAAETEVGHQISTEEVCRSSQCTTVAGFHVVRGAARLQADEHDPPGFRYLSYWSSLPHILPLLYHLPLGFILHVHEETLHKVHL